MWSDKSLTDEPKKIKPKMILEKGVGDKGIQIKGPSPQLQKLGHKNTKK